ncbi:MAG TPA: hypothetical protein VE093_23800 [Polyangiaceae bacterium]|jgi:hypothetical protein|nr:hypothetical protein [Polyangiaceae bacterium]
MLVPETGDGTDKWDVAFDGKDSYTLRNAKTGLYLGSKADPTRIVPMLEGASEPFAWRIERHEGYPEGFTLSPKSSNGATRLSMSILHIFPTPVGWMEPGAQGQVWRLVRV